MSTNERRRLYGACVSKHHRGAVNNVNDSSGMRS